MFRRRRPVQAEGAEKRHYNGVVATPSVTAADDVVGQIE